MKWVLSKILCAVAVATMLWIQLSGMEAPALASTSCDDIYLQRVEDLAKCNSEPGCAFYIDNLGRGSCYSYEQLRGWGYDACIPNGCDGYSSPWVQWGE